MDTIAHCERGYQHWKAFRLDDALAEFDRAIDLSPDCAPAYVGRGFVYHGDGGYCKAIAEFDMTIRLDPCDADARFGRADSRQIVGEFVSAIADYNEAIRLYPHASQYFHRRADAHTAIRNIEAAIDDYRKAIALDSQNPISHYFLAALLADKQAYGDAITHFAEAIRLDPDHLDAFVYASYAWILATCPDSRYRDGETAVKMATTACELDEECNLAILAAAYAEAGSFADAVKWQQIACTREVGGREDLQQQWLELYKSGEP